VDRIRVQPLRGTDNVVVGDLTGTATTQVDVDLSVSDFRVDTLTVAGTPGRDVLRASTTSTTHAVTGLGATVNLVNPERGEKLLISRGGGDDEIVATAVERDRTQPILDGGAGKDTIIGTPGQDDIAGGRDVDVVHMGGGLDTFRWLPGDGNDIVEGGAGTDFLLMQGSGADERFDVTSIGSRTRLTRDIANVNLDLAGMERLDVNPAGGADTTGLAAIVEINRSDPALDSFHIDTKPGNDLVSILPSARELITITTL
jgi:Ca2+-binding RTX toxin-like protein